jgi:hypothetical protein
LKPAFELAQASASAFIDHFGIGTRGFGTPIAAIIPFSV